MHVLQNIQSSNEASKLKICIKLAWLSKRSANMSVQYTADFNGCKIDNFQFKFLEFFFSNFCSIYRLCVCLNLNEAILMSTHNLCFKTKIIRRKIIPVNPHFYYIKVS